MEATETRISFEQLATQHKGWLITCARRYVSPPDDQDIIQESLLRAWKRRHLLAGRNERALRYSLAATIKYVSLEWFRKQHPEQSLHMEPCVFDFSEEETQRHYELLEFLNKEMKKLPRNQQRAFYHRLDGLSYREISGRMNISISCATSNVYLARNKLRAALVAVEDPSQMEKDYVS